MQNSRFVVLTGHLNDYPLSDLVGILRHQRKTGRLLIEYEKGPAAFFFHEGDLVDAKVDELTGLQAVCFALGQPPASFNFNPLIQPSQQTIEDSLQRTVSELFGCWDESNVEIEAEAIDVPLLQETASEPKVLGDSDLGPMSTSRQAKASRTTQRSFNVYEAELLALPPAVVSPSRRPVSLLLMTVAALATLGVSTAIALSGGFRSSEGEAVERNPVVETKSDQAVDSAAKPPATGAINVDSSSLRSRARSSNEASRQSSRAAAASNEKSAETDRQSRTAKNDEAVQKSQTESVTVVMEIENGRVLRASIANPRPGLDSYEALALRIARQRRYSSQHSGRETVKIKVSPSEQ